MIRLTLPQSPVIVKTSICSDTSVRSFFLGIRRIPRFAAADAALLLMVKNHSNLVL